MDKLLISFQQFVSEPLNVLLLFTCIGSVLFLWKLLETIKEQNRLYGDQENVSKHKEGITYEHKTY